MNKLKFEEIHIPGSSAYFNIKNFSDIVTKVKVMRLIDNRGELTGT